MNRALAADLLSTPRTFFELLRRVDALAALALPVKAPLTGQSEALSQVRRRPSWLRLQQSARMDFAAAEVADLEWVELPLGGGPARLEVAMRHFGLFAPYGPLPLHVTEHSRHEHRAVFEQFFGHLTAELAWLDFKVWAQMHPVVGCDVRGRANTFVRRLSSLAAVPMRLPQEADGSDRSEAEHHIRTCRTHFAGIYAGRHRPLHQLGAMLRKYFAVPLVVLPRTGGWRDIDGEPCRWYVLGRWSLGKRVFAPQSAVTILVGPIGAEEFPRFHRRQAAVRWMRSLAEDYASGRVEARIAVDVRTHPGMNGRIGKMRIGIDTWASPVERVVRNSVHEPCMRSATA